MMTVFTRLEELYMKTAYKQGDPEKAVTHIASELQGCNFIIYCADDVHFATATAGLHELFYPIQR